MICQFQEANIAVGFFTINAERESVFDFTYPVYSVKCAMIVLKPTPRGSSLFRVFKSLSTPVWALVISAIVICALLFHGTVTLWNRNRESSENGYTFNRERNSFIHTLMVIYSQLNVHQSFAMPLQSMSSRCILAFWMLFCIVITTSFTSELIGFLTVSDTKPTINSLKDLANSETVFPVTFQGSSFISSFQVRYFLSWQTT